MYSTRGSGSQGISRASTATSHPAKLQRCGTIWGFFWAADMQDANDLDDRILPSNPFTGDPKDSSCP